MYFDIINSRFNVLYQIAKVVSTVKGKKEENEHNRQDNIHEG